MAVNFFRIIFSQYLIIKLISSQKTKQYVNVAPPSIPSIVPPTVVRRIYLPYSGYPPSYTKGPSCVTSYDTGTAYSPGVYSSLPDYSATTYSSPSSSYSSIPTYYDPSIEYSSIPPRYEASLPPEPIRPIPVSSEYPRYSLPAPVTPYSSPPGYKSLPPYPDPISTSPNGYNIVPPPDHRNPPVSSYKQVPLEYNYFSSPPLSQHSSSYTSVYSTPASIPNYKSSARSCAPKTELRSLLPSYSVPPSFSSIPKSSLPPVSLSIGTLSSDVKLPSHTTFVVSTPVTKSSSESPKSSEDTKEMKEKGVVDSKLLNNLAVALQLLIVNNILNTSPPSANNTPLNDIYESVTNMGSPLSLLSSNLVSSDMIESLSPPSVSQSKNDCQSSKEPDKVYYESNLIDQIPLKSFQQICESSIQLPASSFQQYYGQCPSKSIQQLPNASFLPSSGLFGGASLGTLPLSSFGIGALGSNIMGSNLGSNGNSNTRSNFDLMSPYEALGSNSIYSDPILSSPYGNSFNSKDFRSPYSTMLADNDMFSVADIF